MKNKIYGFVFLLIISAVFTSCDNFLDGSELKEDIKNVIDYANAPEFNIHVNAYNHKSIDNISPDGIVNVKKGMEFDIEANINVAYSFDRWIVVDYSTKKEIKDYRKYISIHDTSLNEDAVTKTAHIKILEENPDIEIVPLCYIIYDNQAPVFMGEVTAKRNENPGAQVFEPGFYDEKYQNFVINSNFTSSVFFDFDVMDEDMPYEILFTETLFEVKDSAFVEKSRKSEFMAVPFMEKQPGSGLFNTKFKYNFISEDDGFVKVELQLKDVKGNLSDVKKEFYFIKTSKLNMDKVIIYNKHYTTQNNLPAPEDYSSKFYLENEEKARRTVYWIGADNPYKKLYINSDGGYYTFENTQNVNFYKVSWGFDENCDAGFETNFYCQNDKIKSEDKRIGNFSYQEWSFTLPDSVFSDLSKDIYIKITGYDDSGNEKSVTHMYPKQQQIIHGGFRKDKYFVSMNENLKPKTGNFDNNESYNMFYHVFLKDEYGNFKVLDDTNFLPTSYIKKDCSISQYEMRKDYEEVSYGEEIDTIYIQPVYVKTTNEFIQNYFSESFQYEFFTSLFPEGIDSKIYDYEYLLTSISDSMSFIGGNITYGPISEFTFVKGKLFYETDENPSFNAEYKIYPKTEADINSCKIKIEITDITENGSSVFYDNNWSCCVNYLYPGYGYVPGKIYEGTVYYLAPEQTYRLEIFGFDKVTGNNNVHFFIDGIIDVTAPEFDTIPPSILYPTVVTSNFSYIGGSCLYPEIQNDSNGFSELKYYAIPANVNILEKDFEKSIQSYPVYNCTPKFNVNNSWYTPLPLYFYDENKDYILYCYASDKQDNFAYCSGQKFSWRKYDSDLKNIYGLKLKPEISIDNFNVSVIHALPTINETDGEYDYTCEALNNSKWKNSTAGNQTKSYIDKDKTGFIDFNKDFTLYPYKNTYYRYTGKYIEKTSPETFYIAAPVYFYSGGKIATDYRMMFQSTNGVKLEIDQAAFVHTIYADRDLGSDSDDWEIMGIEVQPEVLSPDSPEKVSDRYYYTDKSLIPAGSYYVTIAYFADGTSTMSLPVKR